MNKLFTLAFFFCLHLTLAAQQKIEIGNVQSEQYVLTADTTILRKALQSTLGDGTVLNEMHIESVNKWHYLVATGIQRSYNKTIAVELQYDIKNRTFYAVDGLAHKTCASAGCNNCVPFKENGNIIGCHCKTVGTVSNECNFKTFDKSPFFYQLNRYLRMKK